MPFSSMASTSSGTSFEYKTSCERFEWFLVLPWLFFLPISISVSMFLCVNCEDEIFLKQVIIPIFT